MEFEKFRERKEYALRVALIDLIEEQKESEKYISVAKTLSEKKEDLKNINLIEFLRDNMDLKLTDSIKSYLYLWCNLTLEQAEDAIKKLFIITPNGVPKGNIKIIESIFRNRSVKELFPLSFKKYILKKFKTCEGLVDDFGPIGLHLTRQGEVDIELIEMISLFDKNKMNVNFWWMSENESISIDALEYYSEEDLDWLAISYRKDLPFSFICKYIDKLCLEILILNNVIDNNIINAIPKCKEADDKIKGKSNEVIKSECHIRFHLHKIHGGWDSVSKYCLMSDDFMIENWDNLNKDILKKYRKLSPRIQALL